MILVLNILMNDVVGKSSQSKASARKKNLDFVGRREFLYSIEDVGGTVSGQHLSCGCFSLWLCVSVVN
jgi:hypothetical protein